MSAWRRLASVVLVLVMAVTPMTRTVELFIDGAWVDVTAGHYVLTEDTITITRGADSRSVQASPGTCTFSLYDPDKNGRWSNRVPGSPNYRKLGRNTPMRFSVDGDVRCVMEIPEWNPRWELGPDGGAKVRAEIEAAGVLRRLTEGARSLRPPAERAILAGSPLAFWPLSDAEGATQAASALSGGKPMTLTDTMDFAAIRGPLGQTSTPEILDTDGNPTGRLLGVVPAYTDDDHWQVDFAVRAEAVTGGGSNQGIAPVSFDIVGTSKFARGKVTIIHDNGFGDPSVNVNLYDSNNQTVIFLSDSPQAVDGEWHHIAVKLDQDGANFDAALWVDGEQVSTDTDSGDIGRVAVAHAPGPIGEDIFDPLDSLSVADLAVFNDDSDPADRYQAFIGHAGETAGRRIERLLSEESVAFASVGDLDDTAAMGPQTADTLVANLKACAVADQGALYETRTELGLTYRTRVSLYNQYGPLLNYSAGHIAPPLQPTEDLAFAHNDVTVTRPGGGSARSTLTEVVDPYHTLSTQAPPDGIGTYDRGPTEANVQADEQLQPLADWLRHLGTWDELRYPSLSVQFAAPDIVADAELAAALAALDTGSQLRLEGLPDWLPPDQVALIVHGSVEIVGTHTRSITWNLRPGWPLEVWQMDSGGSTLAAAVASNGTSLKLATSAGPPWRTGAPLDAPFYIQAAGNAMKVTSLSTDTPAYIAAGAVAHGNNASVSPGLPAGMTPDVGQALLGWAAIRNSGTGTVDLPTNYTELARVGNVLFFGKYYVTGDLAPTVSFTGGAANADTSARLWGMSGVSLELDDGKYRRTEVSPQTLLNGSAANIPYPALTVRRDGGVAFVLAWKQDDATSAATPAAMDAEIIDNSTTTGDDQFIGAWYDIQTTATDIASGSIVMTGGASAISRAITVALRPLQTATVERGVNDVSTAISAGEAIYGWRLGVLGL